MKIRNGFVSNSSSSSFVICKDNLTKVQVSMIRNHIKVCQALEDDWKYVDYTDSWDIHETDRFINGDVFMDNFPMEEFLSEVVNVDMDYVHWLSDWSPSLSPEEILEEDKKTTLRKRKEKLEKLNNLIDGDL